MRIFIHPGGAAMWRAIGFHMLMANGHVGAGDVQQVVVALLCRVGVLESMSLGGLF